MRHGRRAHRRKQLTTIARAKKGRRGGGGRFVETRRCTGTGRILEMRLRFRRSWSAEKQPEFNHATRDWPAWPDPLATTHLDNEKTSLLINYYLTNCTTMSRMPCEILFLSQQDYCLSIQRWSFINHTVLHRPCPKNFIIPLNQSWLDLRIPNAMQRTQMNPEKFDDPQNSVIVVR